MTAIRRFLMLLIAGIGQACVAEASRIEHHSPDFSASGAARICDDFVDTYASRNPKSRFASLLRSESAGSFDQLREEFSLSQDQTRLVELVVSIGTEEQMVALWPGIEEVMEKHPGTEWSWNLPAIAVSCSNEAAVEFLLGQGFDPNQEREGSANFMVTAIVNRDIEMVRLLFDGGYTECTPNLKKDSSLPELALRLRFPEYIAMHERYCG